MNPKKHLVFASIYALSHLLIKCTSFIGAIVHEQRLVPYLSKIIAASNSSIIDYPTRLNCIICLRNLSLVEKPSKLRHDIIKSAFNSILDYLERGEDEQDFCHNAICTLANLSTDDKTAQLIASKRAIELLARFTEQGTNYLLQANALVCLANMCVDERACGQIFRIGNHSFIQLYTSTLISHELRQYIICILHNLIIQHDGASKYFSSVAGFLDELVMSMSSPDELTQNCALNIIHHYLSCKQTLPNLQRQIVECNPVSSLLVILHSHKTAAANKQLASKCFEIIIGIQDSLYGNGIDHFVRIRSEWDEADRIFALEHVSKKGGGGVGGRVVASKTTKMQPSKTSAIRPKSAPNKRS